jgi:pSer/pThr/pTyr-binding forkhead associated (FHA) protein
MRNDSGSFTAILVDRRTGAEFNLCRFSTSLGREPGNDLVINTDKTISRQHALIQYLNGKFHLQDLTSKNGTHLNGSRIEKMTELRNGDEVGLGLTKLIFVLIPECNMNFQVPGARTETIVESAVPQALASV